MMHKLLTYSLILFAFLSCEDQPKKNKKQKKSPVVEFKPINKPTFLADSAYAFIKKQVDFGPRVPNSKAHAKAADYFFNKFTNWNWKTKVQTGDAVTFNGNKIKLKNIIAQYDTANQNRILLMAHWDTRPFADRDISRKNEAIDGANDGASGVGVLMELARTINNSGLAPKVGIDIILFDAEDYGQPASAMNNQTGETWCLGSQYWANNLPENFIKPKYGILLDMVGAKNAVFPKEGVSMQYNAQLVNKIWYLADQLGYGSYFIPQQARGGITDDHLYVNRIASIPSIDIIHYDPYNSDFGSFHHRHSDDMSIIDTTTLNVVGNVVLETIYREQ